MILQHDIRDWAQRKPECHPYLAHRLMLRDYYWQNHCALHLAHPPTLTIERHVRDDRFYLIYRAHMDGAAASLGRSCSSLWAEFPGSSGALPRG